MEHERQTCVRAWLIELRAMWGLVKALILFGFAATARDSRRMLPDLAIRFAIVFPVITCLLLLPPLLNSGGAARRFPEMAHLVSLYLIPSAAVLTLPVALVVAVVLHVFGIAKPVRAQLIRGMLSIGLSCGIASLVLTMWIMPASNQAFRVLVYTALQPRNVALGELPKGVNERSWTELRDLSETGTRAEGERARAAMRRNYILAVVTFLSGLVAAPLGFSIRSRLRQ